MPCDEDVAALEGRRTRPSAVSNQLKALRQARLITVRRDGKMLYYSLSDCHPRGIIHMAMNHIKEDSEA